MKVEIKVRMLTAGNRSLYLEYYETGFRKRENLHLYLVPDDAPNARKLNEQTYRKAQEIQAQNPAVLAQVEQLFAGRGAAVEFVPHSALKEMTRRCKAVIRTGEATPYANIILQSGCIFG